MCEARIYYNVFVSCLFISFFSGCWSAPTGQSSAVIDIATEGGKSIGRLESINSELARIQSGVADVNAELDRIQSGSSAELDTIARTTSDLTDTIQQLGDLALRILDENTHLRERLSKTEQDLAGLMDRIDRMDSAQDN